MLDEEADPPQGFCVVLLQGRDIGDFPVGVVEIGLEFESLSLLRYRLVESSHAEAESET